MTVGWRLSILILAFVILLPAIWHIAVALPHFGDPTSLYGQTVNAIAPSMRNVSNMVAAVNFDVRGLDTLGEESMLLCAVTGAVILLRGSRGESDADRASQVAGRPVVERTEAVVLFARSSVTLILLFGLYVILHGTVTPGGGFQGGVIMASGLLLLYLSDGYAVWRELVPSPAMALIEGGGAFLFVLAAAVPLALGYAALQNILPLGRFRDLYSGGLIIIVNFAVGCSVLGSFALLMLEFMEETRSPEDESLPDEED